MESLPRLAATTCSRRNPPVLLSDHSTSIHLYLASLECPTEWRRNRQWQKDGLDTSNSILLSNKSIISLFLWSYGYQLVYTHYTLYLLSKNTHKTSLHRFKHYPPLSPRDLFLFAPSPVSFSSLVSIRPIQSPLSPSYSVIDFPSVSLS